MASICISHFLTVAYIFGVVQPCALPYWWIQEFSIPPSYLQQLIRPQKTFSYRETISSSDPNNYVHIKEYNEYTWYEHDSSSKSGLNGAVMPGGKTNFFFDTTGPGNHLTPEGKMNGGFDIAIPGNAMAGDEPPNVSLEPSSTTTSKEPSSEPQPTGRGDELERNESESSDQNGDISEGAESNDIGTSQVPEGSTTPRKTGGENSIFGDFFDWGKVLNETEPCQVSEADAQSLKNMIESMFSFPRNDIVHPDSKEKAREDILKKFRELGLQVWTQNFTTPPIPGQEGQEVRKEGVNLVGVIPGSQRGQPEDGIVLVGAHYDTVPDSNGVDDNGSGLAVMMEVAKALTQAHCKFNNTLMFVAFDLEEQGAMGSNHFVDYYLIPEELNRARAHFQGAFILDGIMNFNEAPNTQELPIDYAQSLPGLEDFVNNTGNRGNFLAMISRNNVDSHLTKQLMDAWESLGDHQFKLYNLAVNMGDHIPPAPVIKNHLNFLNSDHATFWYHNSSKSFPETLNAVLLTDTGPFRGQMKKCYHSKCDDLTVMSPEKLHFAKKTADALTATLVELTRATSTGNVLNTYWNLMFVAVIAALLATAATTD